jgi:hypothetical protein
LLTLYLILLLTALALMLFLYVGALFLQGYYYTQPSETIFWGAPAAGLALGLFFWVWCLLIVNSPGANPEDIPYDTIARFSPRVDVLKEPTKELIAVKKDGTKVVYKRHRVPVPPMNLARTEYRTDQETPQPWRGSGVEKIIFDVDGEKVEFRRAEQSADDKYKYREFVSDHGWVIKEMDDGPTGLPQAYRWSRFFMNIFLNVLHLVLWFLGLWLLLRFQWSHALGLAVCLWLVVTLVLLPMLLNYAATVASRG